MIEEVVAKWHQLVAGELPGGLASLIAEDAVFYSPVLFTPQRGKELVVMYLGAAATVFGVAEHTSTSTGFHYVSEVMSGDRAVLEFEAELDGKYVNGIDIITCNADGQITEFKVMIRPLKAIEALGEVMRQQLTKST